MRPILVAVLLSLLTVSATAQVLTPAKWTVEVSRKNVKPGDEIELIFRAKIDDNWYAYANDFDPDCGPLLTEIQFDNMKNFEVVGKLVAVDPKTKHDKVFGCDVKIFLKTGELRQKIKVLGGPLSVKGLIQGQVCTEIDGKCIPFDHEFSINDITVTGAEKKN